MLEVVAEKVSWYWDMRYKISGAGTLAAGFSHVSIWADVLRMDCEWAGRGWGAPAAPSPEEALVGIVHHAPPTMQTSTVVAASVVCSAAQAWDLKLTSVYERDAQPDELSGNPYSPCRRYDITSLYHSATKLAEQLEPFELEACIEVLLDEQSQEVQPVRTELDAN